MDNIMWQFSLDCDKAMENDPNWTGTDEGKACLYWIRKENERLDAILKAQKESPDDSR